jgi:hypothetical protein
LDDAFALLCCREAKIDSLVAPSTKGLKPKIEFFSEQATHEVFKISG